MGPASIHHHTVDCHTVDWNIVKDCGSIATTNRIDVHPIIHNCIAIAGNATVEHNKFEVILPATYPTNSYFDYNYDNKYSGYEYN